MLTLRDNELTSSDFNSHCEGIKNNLLRYGYDVKSVIKECVIFDSNISLDKEWIDG